jgi:hypothetical protein
MPDNALNILGKARRDETGVTSYERRGRTYPGQQKHVKEMSAT